MAFAVASAARGFVERARRFFYEVMLWDHKCPMCGGVLNMIGESRCRCTACGQVLDPTVELQRCSACGGRPVLRISRYQCGDCGSNIPSRFIFDGIVFDPNYFRQKMVEYRQRTQVRREEAARAARDNRSIGVELPALDLQSVPGLLDALNDLADCPRPQAWTLTRGFDLKRYKEHLQAHIGPIAVPFERIPVLDGNPRLDRIWRFVAMIFLLQDGLIAVQQQGQTIEVMQVGAY